MAQGEKLPWSTTRLRGTQLNFRVHTCPQDTGSRLLWTRFLQLTLAAFFLSHSAWEAPPFSSWPAGPAARSLAGITPQLLEGSSARCRTQPHCTDARACAVGHAAIRAEDEALQALPGTVRARLDSARVSLSRRVMSPEHRAKISEALKGRSVNGRRLSSEHKVG